MGSSHIFVGFAQEAQRDRLFAQKLVDDLLDMGDNVALLINGKQTIEDDVFIQTLNQQLAACEYVLVVLSPEALLSTKVQMIVNSALNLLVKQRLRGLFALLAAPIDTQTMPPTWTTIRMFDATQDYPRAFARVQLALTPITAKMQNAPPLSQSLSSLPSVTTRMVVPLMSDGEPIPLVPIRSPKAHQRHVRQWLLPLALVSILGLILGLITYTTYAISKKASSNFVQQPSHPVATSVTTATPSLPATSTAATFPTTPQSLYTGVMQSKPILVDRFDQPDDTRWDISQPNGAGGCQLLNGTYDVTSTKVNFRQICTLKNTMFQNFAFQSQLSFVSGPGPCGFIARMQGRTVGLSYRLYYLANGDFEFLGSENVPGKNTTLIKRTFAHAPAQRITLTLIAMQSNFYIYINGQFIASAQDAAFTSGTLGFICKDTSTPTEAHFMNAKIWSL